MDAAFVLSLINLHIGEGRGEYVYKNKPMVGYHGHVYKNKPMVGYHGLVLG